MSSKAICNSKQTPLLNFIICSEGNPLRLWAQGDGFLFLRKPHDILLSRRFN